MLWTPLISEQGFNFGTDNRECVINNKRETGNVFLHENNWLGWNSKSHMLNRTLFKYIG